MKNKIQGNNSGKKANNEKIACECNGHRHGAKQIFFGLMLLIIGAALNNGYSFPDALMLIGGIIAVKGILVMLCMKRDR